MANRLDQIIVIDIEATCWDHTPPEGQEREIIEIGVCTLDVQSGERLDKESILVRPEHSTVSEFCTQLTTLTQEQVEHGLTFSQACWLLRKRYKTRQRVWASYGDYDRRMFKTQCEARQVRYPFNSTHMNVKSLFAVMMKLECEIGLEQAMQTMGIPMEGTHHRGHDDAWNTALILSHLLRRC